MARRVFVSFLGTNDYLEVIYQLGEKKAQPTRFIQEALIEFLCKDWTPEDRILIFYTDGENGSYKKNWLDNGQPNGERKGLERCLRERFTNLTIEGNYIKEGFSEEEVWSIFDTVYSNLKENDQIYFDVTHAFRSIPMFSTVLFNYARFMKNTEVKSVHYGAFEKLGPSYIVKNKAIEERIAPVIDLTSMVRLQEYTDMASSLKNFGRVKKISETINNENLEENISLSDLSDNIERFDNAISINRMNELKKGNIFIAINNHVKAIRKVNLPKPIKDIIKSFSNELNGFVPGDNIQNVEAAIDWAIKYKMLQQAYTMSLEYIQERSVTVLGQFNRDENPYYENNKLKKKKDFKSFIGSLFSISEEDINNEEFKNELGRSIEFTKKMLANPFVIEMRNSYDKIRQLRNSINHAKGDNTYEMFEQSFSEAYNKCLSIINKYYTSC